LSKVKASACPICITIFAGENFGGCLIGSLYCCLDCCVMKETHNGFSALNKALKDRCVLIFKLCGLAMACPERSCLWLVGRCEAAHKAQQAPVQEIMGGEAGASAAIGADVPLSQ
jgi:hypothetical protein